MSIKLYATVTIDVERLDEDVLYDARDMCKSSGFPVNDENVAFFALESIFSGLPGMKAEVSG